MKCIKCGKIFHQEVKFCDCCGGEVEKLQEVVKKKGCKGSNIIIVAVISLVVLLIIGFISYYVFFRPSAKDVFVKTIDSLYSEFEDNYTLKTVKTNSSVEIDINSNVELPLEEQAIFDIINDMKINIDYQSDVEEKMAIVKIKTDYKEKDLLDASFYLIDGEFFTYLDGVYDKYIKGDVTGYDLLFANISLVTKELKNTIVASLKESYFTDARDYITINGKVVKVNKYTLEINKTNYATICSYIYNSLQNNDKYLTGLSQISGKSKEELKKNLALELAKILKSDFGNINYKFSFYVKDFKELMKLELKVKQDDYYNKFSLTEIGDDIYHFELSDLSNGLVINGSLKRIEQGDHTMLEVVLEDSMGMFKVNGKIDMISKFNEAIDNVLIKDSIYYTDISQEEYNKMMEKILGKVGMKELVEVIKNIVTSKINVGV